MISAFIPKKIKYTGSQLRPLWAYETFGLLGDSIVAFAGPCNIPFGNMIDAEDVRTKSKIYSSLMLHFIVEHFDIDLEKAVLKQRLLATIIKSTLEEHIDYRLNRIGDDIYDAKIKQDAQRPTHNAKLSISIATASPVSTLIHFALNIDSKHTPVLAAGLKDYGINPKEFATRVMQAYTEEMLSVKNARQKVYPST